MKLFELFFWSSMNERWVSWTIVREENLETYLERWERNTYSLDFGSLKYKEILNFGEGDYKLVRMRDLKRYVR